MAIPDEREWIALSIPTQTAVEGLRDAKEMMPGKFAMPQCNAGEIFVSNSSVF
jgi:hypothetical protein